MQLPGIAQMYIMKYRCNAGEHTLQRYRRKTSFQIMLTLFVAYIHAFKYYRSQVVGVISQSSERIVRAIENPTRYPLILSYSLCIQTKILTHLRAARDAD